MKLRTAAVALATVVIGGLGALGIGIQNGVAADKGDDKWIPAGASASGSQTAAWFISKEGGKVAFCVGDLKTYKLNACTISEMSTK